MYAQLSSGAQYATGWRDEPEKVIEKHDEWRAQRPIEFAQLGAAILASDDNAPVFLFDGEKNVRGKVEGAWNQKSVGSCVGFGFSRGENDLMLYEIACGELERDPGADMSPEAVYAGSRVEVGGGRLGNSDGSLGSWAADFVLRWGAVLRKKYGNVDLTTYSETLCRQLGSQGLPADIEAEAKLHPVRSVAVVRNKEEAWAALGAGKPVVPCSNRGFDSGLDTDGFCAPRGSWPRPRGRRARRAAVHPTHGRTILNANSWANYLGATGTEKIYYVKQDGSTGWFYLPLGHFCIAIDKNTAIDEMTNSGDTHTLAGLTGWNVTRLDYTP